jgi:hypothetical protein
MEEPQPLQPQTTGGLWSSWWVSSGGVKNATAQSMNTKEANTPKWYVDRIKGKNLDTKLVKTLISLRVHLSTARVFWVKEFLGTEAGLDVLSVILAGLVGRAGKRKHLSDMEGAVLLEIIKILRVLSNTEVSQRLVSLAMKLNATIAWIQCGPRLIYHNHAYRLFSTPLLI